MYKRQITGINNSSCTSYYASGYKNTVKKAACDIQKTKENSQVSKTEESQEDYVKKLQEKNPQIDIVAGSSDKNVKTANQMCIRDRDKGNVKTVTRNVAT